MPTADDRLKTIKLQLRSYMNGPVSQSLRDSGLAYRVIFGVEWPRLIEMAREIGTDHRLAQQLWQEDIRECRLLAPLVQPLADFSRQLAELWVEQMRYPEEAQYCVMSLLARTPYASEMAFEWIAAPERMRILCGWLILARLFMKGDPLMERSENEFVDQADAALSASYAPIRSAAGAAVVKYALIGEREAQRVAPLLQRLDPNPSFSATT